MKSSRLYAVRLCRAGALYLCLCIYTFIHHTLYTLYSITVWKYNIRIEPSQAIHKPTMMSMDLYRAHIIFVYYFYQWGKKYLLLLFWHGPYFPYYKRPYSTQRQHTHTHTHMQVPYRLLHRNKWTIFMWVFPISSFSVLATLAISMIRMLSFILRFLYCYGFDFKWSVSK